MLEHPYVVLLAKWIWDRVKNQFNERADNELRAAIDKCGRKIKAALSSFDQRRVADKRELTMRLLAGDDTMSVTLVMSAHDFRASLGTTLKSLEREIVAHRDVLEDGDSTTFKYTDGCGWEFCFLTTRER